jgi:hypothetical protein
LNLDIVAPGMGHSTVDVEHPDVDIHGGQVRPDRIATIVLPRPPLSALSSTKIEEPCS